MTTIGMAVAGTGGDLLPCLGVAEEFRRQGHTVVMVAPRMMAAMARAGGYSVVGVGGTAETMFGADDALVTSRFGGMSSWRRAMSQYLSPFVESSWRQTIGLFEKNRVEVVVNHPLAYVGALAAEGLGIPWRSLHLYPDFIRFAGRASRANFAAPLARTLGRIEAELGLVPRRHKVFGWGISRERTVLAHHRSLLGEWEPPRTVDVVGYPLWDKIADPPTSETLAWIAEQRRPIVLFSMGTMIGLRRHDAWLDVIRVCRAIGVAGLLLNPPRAEWDTLSTDVTHAAGFVRLSELVPHVTVLVHGGGAGFLYAGIWAGRPALVAPFAFDQPSNGRMLVASGAGIAVQWSAASLTAGLQAVLANDTYRVRTAALRDRLGDPNEVVARVATALL